MTDKEKIKAEIERLRKQDGNPYYTSETADKYYARGVHFTCDNLLSFINSLPEEPVSSIWHNATDPNDLPEIDREVIAMQGLKGGGSRIVFAHRPPASWIGTNILTGEQTVRKPKRYGKGKWNIENVKWWLDVELPKNLNPET